MPAPVKERGQYLGNPSTEPSDQKYYSPWIVAPVTGAVGVGLYFAVTKLFSGPSPLGGEDRRTEKDFNECIVHPDFDECDPPSTGMDGNSYVSPKFDTSDGSSFEIATMSVAATLLVCSALTAWWLANRSRTTA